MIIMTGFDWLVCVLLLMAGVNKEYDAALKDIRVTQSELEEYLQRQRKRLGCKV